MRAVLWAFVLSLGLVSCAPGTEDTTDDLQAEVSENGKEDAAHRPVGTYLGIEPTAGDFLKLVLKTDMTYHREMLVYCFMAPCNPVVQEGTYKFTRSGATRYIRFYDQNGNFLDRYAYKMAGEFLRLRAVGTTRWATYRHAEMEESWCAVPEDCTLQNLPQPRCPGEWRCSSENTCSYQCGNPCELAGGQCIALTPTSCADGVWGDATQYSCGGMLGVGCCLPKPECPSIAHPSPGFCPNGVIVPKYGDINGVTCLVGYSCVTQCIPECRAVGTRSEGWYDSCTNERICWAQCAGKTATCEAIGTRSEGWYTTDGAGCNGMNLIRWDQCATD